MTKKLSKEFLCKSFPKKLGKTCKDDFEKLQKEYVEDCTIRSQLHEWFKDEGESFESAGQTGRPLSSKMKKIWKSCVLLCMINFEQPFGS